MPAGFEWADLQVDDGAELKELYDLLANNYVEDDDALFRFDYSVEFLKWALTPPGFRNDFLLAVRAVKSRKLVAFISAVPATVRVRTKDPVEMVEINFLCVHKKLRAKRLAPVLIKEITRRANMAGVFQAVYTAGVVLPVPVAAARYHHRSLNPKKLVSVGFSRLAPRMTLARLAKLYKLPAETSTVGLRVMEAKDVPGVHALLTQYLEKFQLSCVSGRKGD
jgi:glycylpeptide N-tetradecanoyltransferase